MYRGIRPIVVSAELSESERGRVLNKNPAKGATLASCVAADMAPLSQSDLRAIGSLFLRYSRIHASSSFGSLTFTGAASNGLRNKPVAEPPKFLESSSPTARWSIVFREIKGLKRKKRPRAFMLNETLLLHDAQQCLGSLIVRPLF